MVAGDPWASLLAQAVLGARQGQALRADGLLGEALARVPAGDLPSATALITAWRRAGRRPRQVAHTAAVAPAEQIPEVSPTAARLLYRFLADGGERDLAGQWIDACARSSRRAPALLVPGLLDFGGSHSTLRVSIRSIIGERGAWLAAQHDAWAWAISGPSASSWVTSTGAERLALVRTVRVSDAAAARDLVLSTWSEDTAIDRAAFLTAFTVGLSAADEPLLERALDDRRKEVRDTALDLLHRLPGAALAKRCQERLASCLTWVRKLLSRKLQVEPPTAYDKSWARDGIEAKPPGGIGERAWWLRQLIASVPVTVWSTAWEMEPAAILTAMDATDWAEPLREGMLASCEHQPDHAWVAAFLAHEQCAGYARTLLARLPVSDQEVLLRAFLSKDAKERQRWLALVGQLDSPWSPAFSKQVVAVMQPLPLEAYAGYLQQLARRLHPSCVHDVAALRRDDTVAPLVDQALAVLDLRRQILQEFP